MPDASPMKPLAVLLTLTLALAGCIAPPPKDAPGATTDEPVTPGAIPPPPVDRIDGMTAQESKTDRDVDCTGSVPPGVCAERELLVTGRIGLDALPVDLRSSNGAIRVVGGAGDAWQMHAIYRVKAASKEEARKALDTAWAWSHESNGQHALTAGPTGSPVPGITLNLLPSQPQVIFATYEVVLPAWVLLTLEADTSNGALEVTGILADDIHLDTSNGAIRVVAHAASVSADTSNGRIDLVLRPTADGDVELDTSNGAISATLLEAPGNGYDLAADTSNGRIEILLRDGTANVDKDEGTFKTTGYDERAIRTKVTLDTSNGAITVAPL